MTTFYPYLSIMPHFGIYIEAKIVAYQKELTESIHQLAITFFFEISGFPPWTSSFRPGRPGRPGRNPVPTLFLRMRR